MRIQKFFLLLFSLLFFAASQAQVIYGRITDTLSNPLEGALLIVNGSTLGSTDAEGRFTIRNAGSGTLLLEVSLLGYQGVSRQLAPGANDSLELNFMLRMTVTGLREVMVSADRLAGSSAVSNITVGREVIASTHGLLEDPLRVISTFPGVGRGGDLFSPSQIYVRGGAPEENLYLLNNARVYFPFYFGGQKSIFNSDVIEKVELLTGGASVKYGNAMSAVLNVTTRDGNRERYGGSASLGFYNSQLLLEGPLGKKASFIVSGRRTYLDLFLEESAEFPVPSFGDVTYKLTFFANEKNRISFSGLAGKERINYLAPEPVPGVPDKLETHGGSGSQSLQWQYFHKKVYSKFSLLHSRQSSDVLVGRNLNLLVRGSEFSAREDAVYYLNKDLNLQAGAELVYSRLVFSGTLPLDPREVDPTDTTVLLINIATEDTSWWGGAYVAAEGRIAKRLTFNSGLRLDLDDQTRRAGISPRISASWALSSRTEFKASYSWHRQHPTFESVKSNPAIRSPLCVHHIAGLGHRFRKGVSGRIEVYYKDYRRLIVHDSLRRFTDDATGSSKGVELFVQKEKGNFTGWISYALSHAKRKANLDPQEYDFDFDQRHLLNIMAQYKPALKKHRSYIPTLVNTIIRFETGRPYTPVTGAVPTFIGWRPLKGPVNSERNPIYLNINLRMEWKLISTKRIELITFMEAWNLLNRKNLQGRTYRYGPQFPSNVLVQPYYATTLLPAGGVRVEVR